MLSIKEPKEIEKIIRSLLTDISEVASQQVRNSLSLYGAELITALNDDKFRALKHSQAMILFELISEPNSKNNVSFDEKDEKESITYNREYRIHLYIYGKDSSEIANKIASRIRTENVRVKAYNQGIFIDEITDPESNSEFVNETMWLRNDMDIKVGVKFTIDSKPVYYSPYENISKLKIKEKNK